MYCQSHLTIGRSKKSCTNSNHSRFVINKSLRQIKTKINNVDCFHVIYICFLFLVFCILPLRPLQFSYAPATTLFFVRAIHFFFSSRIGFSLSLCYYYILLCYFVLFILTVFLFSRPRLSVFQHTALSFAHTRSQNQPVVLLSQKEWQDIQFAFKIFSD